MQSTQRNPSQTTSEDDGRHGQMAVPHRLLLNRLEQGWSQSSADAARDFLSRWSARLQCDVEVRESGDSFLVFSADLGAIRFSGMHEAHCMLVAGSGGLARAALEAFWQRFNSPGRAIFVIAVSEEAEAQARALLPKGRCALLGSELAISLFESDEPLRFLKIVIRSQVARRRLIPFDTEHPIEGHMFCGRNRLLSRLLDEETTNFAVAGPGRIGKTSLLHRFLNQVLRSRDGSRASRFYIDLMPCQDRSPDGLARFIALRVDGSSKVSHLSCDRLEQFLSFHRGRHGRPIDLLLDETDEFLGLDTFQYLGNAARKGLCRLILAGRGNLLKTILQGDSRLHHRIELLRLDPLNDVEAESLLMQPLEDLGFAISERRRVLELLFGLSGKLPQYLQYYGRRICELVIDAEHAVVDPALVARIRDEFETVHLFSSPIFEIKDARTQFAGLALLGAGHRSLTLPHIQGILHNQGLSLPMSALWDVTNELVIQNVLAWNQGKFQVANESLPYYAHTQDFLGSAMRELRPQLPQVQLAS